MQKKADEAQRVTNNKLEAEQRKHRKQIAEIQAVARDSEQKARETSQAMDRMRSEIQGTLVAKNLIAELVKKENVEVEQDTDDPRFL